MQVVVSAIWYRVYYWWMLGISLLLGLLYLVCHSVTKFQPQLTSWDLTSTTLILAIISVGYLLSAYWFIQKRNPGLAILVGEMFFSLLLLNQLFQNSPDTLANIIYLISWYSAAIYSGIYGILIIAGTAFF